MKEHISITIKKSLVGLLKKHARQEKRSVSQLVELALEKYLNQHDAIKGSILTSKSSFKGSFTREEPYKCILI